MMNQVCGKCGRLIPFDRECPTCSGGSGVLLGVMIFVALVAAVFVCWKWQ